MSEPTREDADRWFYGLAGFRQRMVRFSAVPFRDVPRGPVTDWWRSLPDERALAIYREETA